MNDRAAAARDFDASGYALPVPDDGDVAIAAAVLGQQIALVIAPMADAGTDVAAEVVLRSMVKIAGREIHKAGADRQLGVDFGYDDTDVETSLLSRTTKPGKWDGSEGTLLARLHWQRATNLAALDQTLQEVSRSPVEAATAQSAASSTIDIANMAAAGHLTYLAPSLQAGYRSVVACQAEAVKAAPDQTLTTVAQQLAVPTTIASRIKLLAELDTDEIRQRVQLLEAGEAPLYVRQSSRGAVYWANM